MWRQEPTPGKMGEVKIKIRNDNGKPFIATLYIVLLAPYLRDQLFFIIKLINLVHPCLFHKEFCTIFFSDNDQNAVTLPQSTHIKHAFLVKTKEKSKSQKQIPYR